jgi:predicted methyltransferase
LHIVRTSSATLFASMGLLAALASPAGTPRVSDGIAAAIADPRRPTEQVRLDGNRKPALVIAFAGLHSGDQVADFMPGNAYFTRLLSDVVGPRGRVFAFIPAEEVASCPPDEIAGTRGVGRDPSYANVTVLDAPLAKFSVTEKLDMIWTAQNYHDLHDAFLGPPDVSALNKLFFDALKPGGVFLVIDHVAEAGSGLRDTETLHRIDPRRLRIEIEAAGFVLEAHSDVLRNPGDDHTRTVFDPAIRGRTDQVVYRFRKPRRAMRFLLGAHPIGE